MKKKIIDILSHPKIIIPVALLLAIVVGFFVYKNVGQTPDVSSILGSDSNNSLPNVTNGQNIDLAFLKSGKVNTVAVIIGSPVKKGQLLASLDSTDVKGALEIAKANYQKILNGATGPDIDVARAQVASAQTALDQLKNQQDLLVENAHRNLLNSGFIATTADQASLENAPIISGTYLKDAQGQIIIEEYPSSGGFSFKTSGLVEAIGMVSLITPQPIGSTGLFIKYIQVNNDTKWVVNIPNTESSQYTINFNAYQAALSNRTQTEANAEAVLNQAQSALSLKQANARPEDIAAASGSLLVAQSNFNNDFIYAPSDGIITTVNIKTGEIATMNQKVIEMTTSVAN